MSTEELYDLAVEADTQIDATASADLSRERWLLAELAEVRNRMLAVSRAAERGDWHRLAEWGAIDQDLADELDDAAHGRGIDDLLLRDDD